MTTPGTYACLGASSETPDRLRRQEEGPWSYRVETPTAVARSLATANFWLLTPAALPPAVVRLQLKRAHSAAKGIIAGVVTVGTRSGTGAFLEPSIDTTNPTTLTIQSALTFKADGTYTNKLNTKRTTADELIADGVTIEAGAQLNFVAVANNRLTVGTVFTAISNTSATAISGIFANLPQSVTSTSARRIAGHRLLCGFVLFRLCAHFL